MRRRIMESTVNNSDSKLKIYEIHPVGNHLLFPSMGRGTCESKYPRRKVENNNDPKSLYLVAYPPCMTDLVVHMCTSALELQSLHFE